MTWSLSLVGIEGGLKRQETKEIAGPEKSTRRSLNPDMNVA
jgi:hypothetical protein